LWTFTFCHQCLLSPTPNGAHQPHAKRVGCMRLLGRYFGPWLMCQHRNKVTQNKHS
jgi:hypothetical protein